MEKNIVTASEQLPKESRQAFVNAFNATQSMDLYEGDLTQYFKVIAQHIERYYKKVEELENKAIDNEGIITIKCKLLKDILQIVNYAKGFGCSIINVHRDKWTSNSWLINGYRVWIDANNAEKCKRLKKYINTHYSKLDGFDQI